MGKRILIVDGDLDNINYLKTVLEDNGYEVVSAENGDEGLAKAKEFKPNLILLDLMMPKKSGTGSLNEIKQDEEMKNIPIVVQSGASKQTGVQMKEYLKSQPFKDAKSRALGKDLDITPQAYLEKPIDPAELLETIKKFIL